MLLTNGFFLGRPVLGRLVIWLRQRYRTVGAPIQKISTDSGLLELNCYAITVLCDRLSGKRVGGGDCRHVRLGGAPARITEMFDDD